MGEAAITYQMLGLIDLGEYRLEEAVGDQADVWDSYKMEVRIPKDLERI